LFNLKKKVKNKAHVEASICEAYIVEEISTFISYYFEPHLRTRINRVLRHDDGNEVPSSGNLSIFSNIGRPTPKNAIRGRYLSEIEFKQALQDFTVLPTEIFRRSVIRSSSVIFLPTSSPTEYIRRLYFHW